MVDPGIGVEARLAEVLAEHRLRPAAVLLTHGHVDHVYSVTPVCRATASPRRSTATTPTGWPTRSRTLDPALVAMLEQQFGGRRPGAEPDDVVRLTDGQRLTIAGLDDRRRPCPGPYRGVGDVRPADGVPADADGVDGTLLAGDVLFAGSIGRTDLAGGDPDAMMRSLTGEGPAAADDTLVLPGHGPSTTIGRERRSNPFLARAGAAVPEPARSAPPRPGRTVGVTSWRAPPPCPASPSGCPRSGSSSSTCSTRCAGPSSSGGSRRSRPAPSSRSSSCCARARSTRRSTSLRRLHADADEAAERRPPAGPALRPHRAVGPLRARERRASCSSPSGATRSRRCGAASGRRRAATASSRRRTSTSSATASCPSTTRSSWRW